MREQNHIPYRGRVRQQHRQPVYADTFTCGRRHAITQRPDVILIATGSELAPCLIAQDALASDAIAARVVSLPSWELFDAQDQAYREQVLPPRVRARVSVEAGSTRGWERYVGAEGAAIGLHEFGASAPAKELMKHFGFTPETIAAAAKAQVAKWKTT